MYSSVLTWPSLQEVSPKKRSQILYAFYSLRLRVSEGRNEMRHLGAYQLEKGGI